MSLRIRLQTALSKNIGISLRAGLPDLLCQNKGLKSQMDWSRTPLLMSHSAQGCLGPKASFLMKVCQLNQNIVPPYVLLRSILRKLPCID